MALFGYKNVHFELSSEYSFQQLNESIFLEILFKELSKTMSESFYNYEFFIFSNHRSSSIPDSLPLKLDKKKVLIYISDEYGRDPKAYSDYYFSIFKSYVGTNISSSNVFPLPLGYVNKVPQFPVKPINDRKYNVFFRGNLNLKRIDFYRNFSKYKYLLPSEKIVANEPYRNFLIKLKSNFSSHFPNSLIVFNNSFKSGYSTQEYGEILADSKIVLCPKGYHMTECFRHFEAMRAGCVIISEPLPATEFYKGSPIVQVDNWEQGLRIVNDLILDADALERIQNETVSWWQNKCSEEATAKYIFKKLLDVENSMGRFSF